MEEKGSPLVFSEWLKRRRKALDMTQDELAQRAGCSVGALRKIESGDRRPSKQLAVLLAKALEIPNEDQQTFLRVARGDLNAERLRQEPLKSLPALPDAWRTRGDQPGPAAGKISTPPSPSIRIPLQTTSLVGRDAELAALERLFSNPQCRLLTLIGIGGIGKTRLAIEFAARKSALFPGGVFYIPLTPVTSPEKIVPAIADVLDFGFSGPADPQEQLLNYLSIHIQGSALFVLDNLEQLLVPLTNQEVKSGVVALVCDMLERLPTIKILGTSRERLNLHGEWTYELHGLSVPSTNLIGRLEEYEAVELFASSARRSRVDFEVTEKCQSELIQICQLVEGVPLAIELAAAWVGVLSCREIAQEIQSNMDFLTSTMRDLPERHRSMRATFDHSWKLLSTEEQSVLSRLSVFQGGFDRTAAQQVAGASLPLLASLSDKSLVRRTESGRYDLHEVIRQYALSHLDDHPQNSDTYERHCEYYLKMVVEREKCLKSAAQQDAIRQLMDEIDNIRAAWVWAIRHHKFDRLGEAGRGFGWYFEITGLYREGIEQLELLVQALKAGAQDGASQQVLGLALNHQALLFFRKGEFDNACKLYEESILILRPTGDQALLADSLVFLGTVLHLRGEYERARSLLQEGLLLARQSNEKWFEAWAIYNTGHIDGLVGRYEEGYEQMLAGLTMWRSIGDPQVIALGLNFMIPALTKLGRYEEAKTYMYESIALSEQSKNRWGLGTAYRYLGLACLAGGQYAEAQAHFSKSLEIFGGFAVGWDIARSLTYLGDTSMLVGDPATARRYYLDALRPSIEANAVPIALDALLGLGSLGVQAGKAEQALMLSFYILDHPSSEEETRRRAEALRASLEPTYSPEQVGQARQLAKDLSFDSLVREALESTEADQKT